MNSLRLNRRRAALAALSLSLTAALSCARKGNGSGTLGRGSPGTPSLSPERLDFGKLPVGQVALAQVTLTNVGSAALSVTSVKVDGDFAVAQALALNGGTGPVTDGGASNGDGGALVLNADLSESATLVVSLVPAAVGTRSGTLTVSTVDVNQVAGSASVDLTGLGIDDQSVTLKVTPDALAFNPTQSLHRSVRALHVINPNPFPVQVYLSPPVNSGDGGDFSSDFAVPTIGPGLAANQAADVEVGFIPAAAESASASTNVAACPGCPATTVQLSGRGVDSSVRFDPPAIDFGFVTNDPSPVPTVQVTASFSGDVPVTIDFTNVPGSPFSLVEVSPPLPLLLSPDGGSQHFTFSVSYQPSGVFGGDLQQLAFPYSLATGGTKTAYLPAVGNRSFLPCRLQLVPSGQLDFGSLPPGASATRPLTLVNSGANDCEAAGLVFAPPADPAFTLGGAADGGLVSGPQGGPFVVLAHGSLDALLTFTAPLNSVAVRHQAQLSVSAPGQADDGLGLVLLGEVSSPYLGDSPWPKAHHDNANSGQGRLAAPGFDGGLLWRAALNPAIAASLASCRPGLGAYQGGGPVLGPRDRVYQLGCDGVLHEFDALSGAQNAFVSLPAPDEGQLITPTLGENGTLTLGYESDAGLVGFATEDGGAFFGSALFFVGLDPFTLQLAASAPQLPLASGPSPVLQGPTLTLGAGALYDFGPSLNPVTGAPEDLTRVAALLQGSQQAGHDFLSSGAVAVKTLVSTGPAVDGQSRSFWCSEGSCVALSPTLEVVWARTDLNAGVAGVQAAGAHGSPLLVGDSLIYQDFFVSPDSAPGTAPYPYFQSTLYALDPADGHTQWSVKLPEVRAPVGPAAAKDPFLTLLQTHLPIGPALAPNGDLLVPFVDGIYCYGSVGPGPALWHAPIAGGVAAAPAVSADGTVFAASLSQGLVALDLSTGHPRGAFAIAGRPPVTLTSAPAIGPQAIYFTADDGYLYAVH